MAQICNADVSGPVSSPYREKLDRATANQGAQFCRISDRKKDYILFHFIALYAENHHLICFVIFKFILFFFSAITLLLS